MLSIIIFRQEKCRGLFTLPMNSMYYLIFLTTQGGMGSYPHLSDEESAARSTVDPGTSHSSCLCRISVLKAPPPSVPRPPPSRASAEEGRLFCP